MSARITPRITPWITPWIRGALALAASTSASCSFLYEPGQFRTTDASVSPEVDAFVPVDIDASLDAWTLDAPGADVPTEDAPAHDAAIADAFAPDATLDCPEVRSLALPTCSRTVGLYYCPPSARGDVAMLSPGVAMAVQPRFPGHRLGLLGNGIDVISAPGGSIVDHEITRSADQLVLHALSRDAIVGGTTAPAVVRRAYEVGAGALTELPIEAYEVTLDEVADLSLSPGVLDSLSVLAADSSGVWATSQCPALDRSVTTPLAIQPGAGVVPRIANADRAVIAAFAMSSRIQVQRVQPGPSIEDDFAGGALGALRSTADRLVYTDGAPAEGQNAFDVGETATTVARIGIGAGRPRIARVAADRFALVRLREMVGGVTVLSSLGLDCSSGTCACAGGSCMGPGTDELTITLGGAPIRDWTYHEVGDVRVAVFLTGDSAGTDVLVALWAATMFRPVITPVMIASGRLGDVVGVGRSIRSVVTASDDRLEVFVSALVDSDGADVIYLSGMRLEGCAS